jgi:lipopolysaccharide export system ATP-binding protein
MRRSKETVRKVLSWLRSKQSGDSSAAFADAWRLDEAGAPHTLERRAKTEGRTTPEPRNNPASRPQQPTRPAQANDLRPQQPARPMPAKEMRPPQPVRPVQGIETRPQREQPAAKPAPVRDSRVVQELRPASAQRPQQQSRVVQELRPKPAAPAQPQSRLLNEVQELRRATERHRAARQQTTRPQQASLQGTLAAAGLVKSFGGRRVVNDVTIGLRRGEAVGLLGPNGAGKTTVFYMIVGLIHADTGKIMLDGHDVTSLPMYRRARLGIGYLPQEPSIFRGLSVEDNIRAVLEAVEPDRDRREQELNRLLDEFNVDRVRKSPAIALSGGERRRVEIARALATRPSFMLLDEPFAGIDPIAVGDIQELVRHLTRRGIGVLITDHNVRETLGLVDRAYIVHSGSILMEGDPNQIVQSEKVRRVYLGEEFRL